MIRAYKKVEETDQTTTYEYNSVCGYWLYLTAVGMGVGYVFELPWVQYAGLAGLAGYFLIIYFPAVADARRIKSAIKINAGQISGSRWSFSNPLRITISKETQHDQA